MSWIRFSDTLVDEPCLLELGDLEPLAGWTYMRLVSYCAKHLTDGLVPVGMLRRENQVAITALFGTLLLEHRDDGAYLPLFLDRVDDDGNVTLGHHPSKEFIEDRRRARIDAGRLGGKARAVALAKARALALAKAGATAPAKANGKQTPKQTASKTVPLSLVPGPSSPYPDREPHEENPPPPPAKRGRRANGTNARAVGANPRATGDAPRDLGDSPRQERQAQKTGPTALAEVMAEVARRAGVRPNGHASTGQGSLFDEPAG